MWFVHEDLEAIEELEKGSDRSVAIIAYALIDARLTKLLRSRLSRDDESDYGKKIRAQLFNPDGALGSFGIRNSVCYLLGLLSEQAHSDLRTLIKMRNDFAHYTEHFTFNSESMKTRCFNLKLIDTRVRGHSAYYTPTEGQRVPMDSMSSSPDDNYVALNLVNHEAILADPKQRFIATAKLFVAACYVFSTHSNYSLGNGPIL